MGNMEAQDNPYARKYTFKRKSLSVRTDDEPKKRRRADNGLPLPSIRAFAKPRLIVRKMETARKIDTSMQNKANIKIKYEKKDEEKADGVQLDCDDGGMVDVWREFQHGLAGQDRLVAAAGKELCAYVTTPHNVISGFDQSCTNASLVEWDSFPYGNFDFEALQRLTPVDKEHARDFAAVVIDRELEKQRERAQLKEQQRRVQLLTNWSVSCFVCGLYVLHCDVYTSHPRMLVCGSCKARLETQILQNQTNPKRCKSHAALFGMEFKPNDAFLVERGARLVSCRRGCGERVRVERLLVHEQSCHALKMVCPFDSSCHFSSQHAHSMVYHLQLVHDVKVFEMTRASEMIALPFPTGVLSDVRDRNLICKYGTLCYFLKVVVSACDYEISLRRMYMDRYALFGDELSLSVGRAENPRGFTYNFANSFGLESFRPRRRLVVPCDEAFALSGTFSKKGHPVLRVRVVVPDVVS